MIWGGEWYPDVTCDDVVCETNCGGDCSPGEIQDCFGNCVPITWIGDGICNNGCIGCPQWDTEYIYLNCEEFGYDGGDCSPPADLPINPGACCIGALDDCDGRYCENKLYADCLAAGGQYLGENTICVDQACSCPPGQTADCNGNCFPLYYLNDGICHDGHWYPENGEDYHEYQLNLGCIELACDYGDCTGICSGACCVGQNCFEGLAFNQCAEEGGTFLGGGEVCSTIDCSNYLIPQSIGVELVGNENPIVGISAHSVAASDGVFVQALYDATNSTTGQSVTAGNIYRGNSTLSETLYFSNSSNGPTSVDTDGTRVILSQGTRLRVYVDNGSEFTFEQELASGFDISNMSISDDVIFVTTDPPSPGGAVDWFKRTGNTWVEQSPILDGTFATNVVVDGDLMAVLTNYSVMMYSYDGADWNSDDSGYFSIQGTWQDVDIDGNYVVLGETTNYYNGIVAQARVFKKTVGTWYLDANLIPVDTRPDDEFGYSVSIEDGVACISGRLNDSSILNGGMVAVFKKLGDNWVYTNRIIPYNPVSTMGFGAQIATDGISVIATWEAETEDIWTEGDRGSQFVALPEFEWSNPEGGAIDLASNWIPTLPSFGDSASISIPAQFDLNITGSLPFSNLQIGPSKPTFNLGGQDVILNGKGLLKIAGTPSFTGDLQISDGNLTVNGDVRVGQDRRPAALSIASDASLTLLSDLYIHKNSQLQVELGSSESATLLVQNSLTIDGSLIVSRDGDQVTPSVGDSWVIFESQQSLDNKDRFEVVVMPGIGQDKYFHLEYQPFENGTRLVATAQSIQNLYDLENTDSVNVSGLATDIAIADFGSQAGPADGFDDIALSIGGSPGSVYIFMNDGSGGVGSQITYPAGNNPSSIDAGDLDEDGTFDLVITNGDDDSFFVLLNNGGDASSMAAQSPTSTGDLPVDILIVNIDDDGDQDIVVACSGEEEVLPDGTVPGELRFYAVTPSMQFGVVFTGMLLTENPGKIKPGDVTNDKDFQISVSLKTAGKLARSRRIVGTRGFDWQVVQEVPVGAEPSSIAVGDLNNDGRDDAVVANEGTNTVSILVMNVSGVYENEIVIEVGNQPSSVELLDYDGDGDLDFAVIASNTQGQRTTYVYRNDTSLNPNQTIMFALEQTFDEGLGPILLGSGEMDGDAAQELVSILSSTGFRGANDSVIATKSVPESSTCQADLDNSGTVDILDLLSIISSWGTPDGDLNNDGTTDVLDVLEVIANWGPCS